MNDSLDDLALVRRAFRDPCTDPEASRRRTLALIDAGASGRPRSALIAMAGIVAIAIVVVVLIAAVPLFVSRDAKRPIAPDTSSSAIQYRRPLELTVALAASAASYPIVRGTYGGRQFIKIYSASSSASPDLSGGVVLVYDPGTLDPATFAGGDAVQVHGQTGHYITDFRIGQDVTAAVGWPDTSGAWVVVCGLTGVDNLIALGNVVELGAPHPLPAPYRLGYLPPDLSGVPISYAQNQETHTTGPDSVDSVVSFGGTPPELWHPFAESPPDVPFTIRVNDRSAYSDSHDGPPNQTKIAGYDNWYVVTGNTALLVVKTATCRVGISVNDRTKYPYEELKRIVEGMQIHDCTKPATWTAALG